MTVSLQGFLSQIKALGKSLPRAFFVLERLIYGEWQNEYKDFNS